MERDCVLASCFPRFNIYRAGNVLSAFLGGATNCHVMLLHQHICAADDVLLVFSHLSLLLRPR